MLHSGGESLYMTREAAGGPAIDLEFVGALSFVL
jgi:hypothetical protein